MQPRTLSSDLTPLVKFALPVVMLLAYGFAELWSWPAPAQHPIPQIAYSAVWLFGVVIVLFTSAGLKRIRADDHQLFVSNYLRETSIPFSAIADVKQNRWINSKQIQIYFSERTEFGDRVSFVPKKRARIWRHDPAYFELRKLAGLSS